MSIVLRCPNCGTTQGHSGECDACAEGEVRYFCTNHDAGTWLDGPVCTRCGAKFGDPPRRPVPAPAPAPPPAPRPRRAPTAGAAIPEYRAPERRRTLEAAPEPDFAPPPRRPDPDAPLDPEVLPPTRSLGDLLEEISKARARRRAGSEVDETPAVGPPRPGIAFPLAGCLVRILGLGFLLFLAVVALLFLLFGSLIGG